MASNDSDVLILGAGAAGLLCAAEAGNRGRRVVVLERNQEPGRKILISGGGRCNFTNLHSRPENFLSQNPHFAKSALARYTPRDFIAMVEKHGIAYHQKTLGQLFCDRSAKDIVALLTSECRSANVRIVTGCEIQEVTTADRFQVETNLGGFVARSLVVATGGLSIPKLGSSDLGYRIAQQFGLRLVPPRPALVPLTFTSDDKARYCDLAGISLEVIASTAGARFREKLLVTHRGVSGPAILQISSYLQAGDELVLDLLPEIDLLAGEPLREALSRNWPRRFLDRWLEVNQFPRELHLSAKELTRLSSQAHHWTVRPGGTEGFAKAEVTLGGVDTAEISSTTMEARRQKGLYFIGEVLDVTGHLGGFNFQWAWSSGYAAGQAV